MRINKYLASSGIASRRESDKLVQDGRVTVNGKVVSLGIEVSDSDKVCVDGKPVCIKKNESYILNKPKGYICSAPDDRGRKTVLDLMPKNIGKI